MLQTLHISADWRGWWAVNFLLFLIPRKFRKFRKFNGDDG
jgi:hypothetical protein